MIINLFIDFIAEQRFTYKEHFSTEFESSGENGGHRSATSISFEIFPYRVSQETGFIDYDKLEEKSLDFRPKIIICGGSSYPRDWDYARFHAVHPFFGSFFYTDLSHVLSFLDIKNTYLLA